MKFNKFLRLFLLSLVLMLAGITNVLAIEVTYYDGGQQKRQEAEEVTDGELNLTNVDGEKWWYAQSSTNIKDNQVAGSGIVNLIFSGNGSLGNNTLTLGSGVTLKLFKTENNTSQIGPINNSIQGGGTLYLGSGNLTVSGGISGTNVEVNAGEGMLYVRGTSGAAAISLNGTNSVSVSSGTLWPSGGMNGSGISLTGEASVIVSGGKLMPSGYGGNATGITAEGNSSVTVKTGGFLSASTTQHSKGYVIDLSGGSLTVSDGGVVNAGLAGGDYGIKASGSSWINLSGGSTLLAITDISAGIALSLSGDARLTVNDSYLNVKAYSKETCISGGDHISVDDGTTGVFFLSPGADMDGITKAKNPEFGALVFSAKDSNDQWEGTAYGSVNVPDPGFELYTGSSNDSVQIGKKLENEATNSNYPVKPRPTPTTATADKKGTISIPESASLSASAATVLGQYVDINLGSASEIKGGEQYAYTTDSSPEKGGQLNLNENITLNGTTINNAGTVTVDGFAPSVQGYSINNLYYGEIGQLNSYTGTGGSDILGSVGLITNIDGLEPNSETNKITYPVFFDVSKPSNAKAQITATQWTSTANYTSPIFNGQGGSSGTKGVNTYIYKGSGSNLPLPGNGSVGKGIVSVENQDIVLLGWAESQQTEMTKPSENASFTWPEGSGGALYLFGQFRGPIDLQLNTGKAKLNTNYVKTYNLTGPQEVDGNNVYTFTVPVNSETGEYTGDSSITLPGPTDLEGTSYLLMGWETGEIPVSNNGTINLTDPDYTNGSVVIADLEKITENVKDNLTVATQGSGTVSSTTFYNNYAYGIKDNTLSAIEVGAEDTGGEIWTFAGTVTFKAQPQEDSEFLYWILKTGNTAEAAGIPTKSGSDISYPQGDSLEIYIEPGEKVETTAVFGTDKDYYPFTVSVSPDDTQGTVTVEPNVSVGSETQLTAAAGQDVTFKVLNPSSGNNGLNLPTSIKLTANNNGNSYNVSWIPKGLTGTYSGNQITVSNQAFSNTGSYSITANFENQSSGGGGSGGGGGGPVPPTYYTVRASVSPVGSGTVNGKASFSQSYAAGSRVTLTAAPSNGYHFAGWESGGKVISQINPMTVTVNSSLNYTALFVRNTAGTPEITFEPDSLELETGETGTVKVTLTPETEDEITVESSDSEVAIAAYNKETGEITVTATGPGIAVITLTCAGASASFEVTVEEASRLEGIEVIPSPIYLTAAEGTGYIHSQELALTSIPEGIDLSGALVTASPASVATVRKNSDGVWTVTAVSDGMAELTVSMDGIIKTVPVIVSSNQVVAGPLSISGVYAWGETPDYFNVSAQDLIGNPAMGLQNREVVRASVFCWSETNQSDINAKEMLPLGDGSFGYSPIPVNDTPVNNYFIKADDIKIAIYASLDPDTNGDNIANLTYSWINDNTVGSNDTAAFITYGQNIGFNLPTVLTDPDSLLSDDLYSGSVGIHRQLEGLRVSSTVEGLEVNTAVHAENIGWMNPVGDGVYAGTMHENRQIESVKLTLSGEEAPDYTVRYRVHQENVGWSDWYENGQEAGITGRHLQLEAVQVMIVPAG